MMKKKFLISTLLFAASTFLLLQNPQVNADEKPTTEVTLNHNTYIYNKNAKRVGHKKLYSGSKVVVNGQLEKLQQNKKYFTFKIEYGKDLNNSVEDYYWLPYRVNKGWAYYQLKDGGFIKVANVKKVDNKTLFSKNGYVTTKRKTYFYDEKGNRTAIKVGEKKKFKVDSFLNLKPHTPSGVKFYHIANTNHYLLASVVTSSRTPLYYQSLFTTAKLNKTTKVYNEDGTVRSTINPPANQNSIYNYWTVNEVRYITPQDSNTKGLYYRLANNQAGKENKGGFISEDALTVIGPPVSITTSYFPFNEN